MRSRRKLFGMLGASLVAAPFAMMDTKEPVEGLPGVYTIGAGQIVIHIEEN